MAAEAVAAAGLKLRRDMPAAMTGEDFSWFLQQRPGAFVWIGNGPADGGRELHNANYDFNDAILPAASGYLASVAKRAHWDDLQDPACRKPGPSQRLLAIFRAAA